MYDVIVIGGGTAGLGAYRQAKKLGKKALIVEANDFVTTCASVGCMPSKLLIAASENMHEIKKSSGFGINVGNVSIDEEKLLNRVRSERDRFVGFVKEGAEKISSDDCIIGYAQFINKNTIEVNGKEYTAKAFVIATGSRVFYPGLFNEHKNDILTNENVFEITNIPKSLAVIGAGVIGLELGFAFHNLGTKVTMFNRGNKVLRLNKDINDYVVKHIQDSFNFVTETEITKIERVQMGDKLGFRLFYNGTHIDVEQVLVAAGRKANIDNLHLEKTEITDPLKQFNPETAQISDSNIFLAGDVNNHAPLLHEAAFDGITAGSNAGTYPEISNRQRLTPISIVFSNPQIMQVGQTTDLPEDVIKGTVSFENQGRSRVMLKNKGMLNIYFDRISHKLLGAEMIGPSAEHLAHLLAWQIARETTLEDFKSLPFYHPVVEEGLKTAYQNALSQI